MGIFHDSGRGDWMAIAATHHGRWLRSGRRTVHAYARHAGTVRCRSADSKPAICLIFQRVGSPHTALLVAGRVGAGIGAGIANMRVTEQIDAIESLSVDSFKMLVVTRIVACILIL